MTKLEHALQSSIELESQAKRDKAHEAVSQERIERLLVEIEAASEILERLPQDKRKGLLIQIRAVQIIQASIASQEGFAADSKHYINGMSFPME